jgi:hypothetical protein
MTLAATVDSAGTIQANGALTPAEATVVAVDFIDPQGGVFTRYALTNAGGNYACSLPTSSRNSGSWVVRAFWQGDLAHAGVVAPQQSLGVRGNPNQPPPPLYAKCPGS